MQTLLTFLGFIFFVAFYSWYKLRNENLNSKEGYFLGGRSLTGVVIAGSMILTNISTEHLIGMNGSSYKNGFIIIAWEVTSAEPTLIASSSASMKQQPQQDATTSFVLPAAALAVIIVAMLIAQMM